MDHTASLAIRSVVGFPLAYVGGFIGMIIGNYLIPTINQDDFTRLLIVVLLIGVGVTIGYSATWLTFMLEWSQRLILAGAIFIGASAGGLIAFYAAEELTGNSDLYILVREITQSTIIGAVIAAVAVALAVGILAPRRWRS